MLIFRKPKRPWEEDYFGFDFKTWPLPAGVSITAATFNLTISSDEAHTGVDPDPDTMKLGGAVMDGTKALQFLRAGVHDVPYILHCKAATSDGRKLEECGLLWVRDC